MSAGIPCGPLSLHGERGVGEGSVEGMGWEGGEGCKRWAMVVECHVDDGVRGQCEVNSVCESLVLRWEYIW